VHDWFWQQQGIERNETKKKRQIIGGGVASCMRQQQATATIQDSRDIDESVQQQQVESGEGDEGDQRNATGGNELPPMLQLSRCNHHACHFFRLVAPHPNLPATGSACPEEISAGRKTGALYVLHSISLRYLLDKRSTRQNIAPMTGMKTMKATDMITGKNAQGADCTHAAVSPEDMTPSMSLNKTVLTSVLLPWASQTAAA